MPQTNEPLSDLPVDAGSKRSEILKGVLAGAAVGALVVLVFSPFSPQPHGGVASAYAVAMEAMPAEAPLSVDARMLVEWIATADDAGGSPFVVVDKRLAQLHVFDGRARWIASTPVLLGGAVGDDTIDGIGERPIEEVRPEERTTPAGRFVGTRGHNARGEDVVWVDYDAGVSIHRVLTTDPRERRLERLATPTHEDNRISWGCINVPVAFYEARVRPLFAERRAPVYILPEVRPLAQVFGIFDDAQSAMQTVIADRESMQDVLP